jgi:cytochrome b6-f complex iron-sulfur subunit
MSLMQRRQFLSGLWMAGAGLVAVAGVWTTWDLLRPGEASGFGGRIRAVPPESVPDSDAIDIPAARSYLVNVNGTTRALSQKCTHLGCRVSYCESSGEFECPCHGSTFNRAGEFRTGPAPRGMDEHPVELSEDGLLYIDTGTIVDGPSPGPESIDEPRRGPSCATEGH